MAEHEFDLKDGLKIGDKDGVQKHVVLRELTAGDIIEASQASERVAFTQSGETVLTSSPSLLGVLLLCQQIKRLGDLDGPIPLNVLKRLSADDFTVLQQKSDAFDQSLRQASKDLENKGRGEGGSA